MLDSKGRTEAGPAFGRLVNARQNAWIVAVARVIDERLEGDEAEFVSGYFLDGLLFFSARVLRASLSQVSAQEKSRLDLLWMETKNLIVVGPRTEVSLELELLLTCC